MLIDWGSETLSELMKKLEDILDLEGVLLHDKKPGCAGAL